MQRFGVLFLVVGASLFCTSCGGGRGGDPIIGKWGIPDREDYWQFNSDGSLKQYQQINFQSGRRVFATMHGTWDRISDKKIRLKITKIDPPDIKGGDADLEIVSLSANELKVRGQAGSEGTLVRR